MYDLIVIGAGPGGYEAAAHAGKLGKKVALIEKEYIGGTCLNVGCIPTKTLLKSAKILSECKEAELYGVTTSAPSLDMKKVQERKTKVISTLTKGVEGMLKRNRVETIIGKAKLVGKNQVKVGSKKYEAANILIATGSKSATPPIPGIDAKNVLDSTKVLNLSKAPESLVVIGGGVIGLEFACFFSELGTQVTVIEMLPDIAAGIDSEIAKKLLLNMKKAGVKFHLSCKVTKIDGNAVNFETAEGKKEKAEGEYILNSTGRVPVLEGLGLEDVGVSFDRRGIKTDELGKTSVPGVWACGDCTGRCLLAHAATREGIVAVNNMFGNTDRIRYTAIPGVVYTHPEVASVGKTEDQLKAEGVEYKKSTMPMAIAGRFIVENEGKTGTIKVLTGAKYGEVLGVHMIGDPCGEIIFGAGALIEMEMTVDDVKQMVYPHPTVSEALKEAISHIA